MLPYLRWKNVKNYKQNSLKILLYVSLLKFQQRKALPTYDFFILKIVFQNFTAVIYVAYRYNIYSKFYYGS